MVYTKQYKPEQKRSSGNNSSNLLSFCFFSYLLLVWDAYGFPSLGDSSKVCKLRVGPKGIFCPICCFK